MYYFITYQAKNYGNTSTWNQVINISPMEFIKNAEAAEKESEGNYRNFVVLNTCLITKEQFELYQGHF